MPNTVLKAENISKQYRLGQLGTGTISHDLNRAWAKMRGKEDPYLKVGDVNDRSKAGGSDYVWSLKDINFDVKQGEVLGIIGKNGAGKSTLLKILSQVTTPTTGQVKVKGRIAALLEVGTGFHPDLSGRENILLNGAILGMTKQEIRSKLDEIIDFSGVAKYLDTPVKRYSSGMTVRLGFAIAAHLDPEILIVDEVLAVGDAEFQKKCIGKMKDVSGEGRTVLFVTHNMEVLSRICTRAIMLTRGQIEKVGSVSDVITHYLSDNQNRLTSNFISIAEDLSKPVQIREAKLINGIGDVIKEVIDASENYFLEIHYQVHKDIKNLHLIFQIENAMKEIVCFSDKTDESGKYEEVVRGEYIAKIQLTNPLLNKGKYYITMACMDNENELLSHVLDGVLSFEMTDIYRFRTYSRPGNILQIFPWNFRKKED